MLGQSVDVLSSVEVLTHLKQWREQTWVSCFCCSTSATHSLWLVVSAWTDPEEFSFPPHRELCGAQNAPGNMLLGFGTSKNLSYCYSVMQTLWESTPASLNMGQMSQTAQTEPNTGSWLSKLSFTRGNSSGCCVFGNVFFILKMIAHWHVWRLIYICHNLESLGKTVSV